MTQRSPEREQFYKDLLTTAVEGGINYWAAVSNYDPDNGTVTVYDMDEEAESGEMVEYEVNLDTIARGVRKLVNYFAPTDKIALRLAIRTNGEDGDFDSCDADAILQFGIFGQLVYG